MRNSPGGGGDGVSARKGHQGGEERTEGGAEDGHGGGAGRRVGGGWRWEAGWEGAGWRGLAGKGRRRRRLRRPTAARTARGGAPGGVRASACTSRKAAGRLCASVGCAASADLHLPAIADAGAAAAGRGRARPVRGRCAPATSCCTCVMHHVTCEVLPWPPAASRPACLGRMRVGDRIRHWRGTGAVRALPRVQRRCSAPRGRARQPPRAAAWPRQPACHVGWCRRGRRPMPPSAGRARLQIGDKEWTSPRAQALRACPAAACSLGARSPGTAVESVVRRSGGTALSSYRRSGA